MAGVRNSTSRVRSTVHGVATLSIARRPPSWRTAETNVKQSYAETAPDDADTQGKIDTVDALLDVPDVKAALLRRMGVEESGVNKEETPNPTRVTTTAVRPFRKAPSRN